MAMIEIMRHGVTESSFKAQIRYYMKKKGLEDWLCYITKELGNTIGHSGWNKTEFLQSTTRKRLAISKCI